MPSHKKARKIVSARPNESQAPRQPQENEDFKRFKESLDILCEAADGGDPEALKNLHELGDEMHKMVTDVLAEQPRGKLSKSRAEKATSSLFTPTKKSRRALLALTGAPGIIRQSDLERFRKMDAAWGGIKASDYSSGKRPPHADLGEQLKKQFESGFLVEPGRFWMRRQQSGNIWIGDNTVDGPPAASSSSRSPHPTPAAQVDTNHPITIEDKPGPLNFDDDGECVDNRYYNICALAIDILDEGVHAGNPVSLVRIRHAAAYLLNLANRPEHESETEDFEEIPNVAFGQDLVF